VETRKQILIYAVLLAPLGVAPWFIGMASVFYAGLAGAAGALFVYLAWQLFRSGDHAVARRLFGFSILYLFVLFLALVADRAIQQFLLFGIPS
jgi:protoheme IX farnesyltransferase